MRDDENMTELGLSLLCFGAGLLALNAELFWLGTPLALAGTVGTCLVMWADSVRWSEEDDDD